MKQKVYLVIGTYYGIDHDDFTIVEDNAVYATLDRANEALDDIVDEVAKDAKQNNYNYEDFWVYNENGINLEIKYENGDIEVYQTYERDIIK